MIEYFAALVLSYLGLAGGIVLYSLAREEVKDYAIYLTYTGHIIALLTLFFALYDFFLLWAVILACAFFGLALYSWQRMSLVLYPLMGVLFKIGYPKALVPFLIFLYGLPIGSLLRQKKTIGNVFLIHLSFIIVGIVVMFL